MEISIVSAMIINSVGKLFKIMKSISPTNSQSRRYKNISRFNIADSFKKIDSNLSYGKGDMLTDPKERVSLCSELSGTTDGDLSTAFQVKRGINSKIGHGNTNNPYVSKNQRRNEYQNRHNSKGKLKFYAFRQIFKLLQEHTATEL